MAICYQFLPWVRRGLGVALDTVDHLGALPPYGRASIGIQLAGLPDGGNVAPLTVQLYGPGDVVGLDTRLVVRTDPRPGTTNFEPNYLAIVEFDPPDLPWMLTPALANADDRLRPWLVLVVLRRDRCGHPRLQGQAPLPQIRVPAEHLAEELPPLAESWSWAHAQVVSARAAGDVDGIRADLQGDPRSNVSRLVCPRRLAPDTDYVACVVPAFEPGRLRGLGQAGDTPPTELQPAWNPQAGADVVLPVYHHWEFSTGAQGDFESLARRLRSPKKWQNDAATSALLGRVGTSPMSVDALLDGDAPARLTTMEGALVPLGYVPGSPPAAEHAASLAAIVDTPAGQVDNPVEDEPDGSVRRQEVKPPLYGAWHARRHAVTPADEPGWWLAGLNLNPRYRAAAGYGAEVVRRHQEDYVDACWDQVGTIREAAQLLNFTRLAIEVQRALKARHFDPLPPERLLQLAGPALARIEAVLPSGAVAYRVDGRTASLGGQVERSSLPAAMVDGALRRGLSPQRRTLRLAAMRGGVGVQTLPALATRYLGTMAEATRKPSAFEVNAFLADGVAGTRLFDGVALPAADDARVELGARGLRVAPTAGRVRAALAAGAAARAVVERGGVPLPRVRAGQSRGVFTDVHVERFAALAGAASGLGPADLGFVAAQVEALGRRGVEGLLVEAQTQGSALQFSALRIDARSGSVRVDRPLLRFVGRGAPQPAGAAVQRAASGLALGSWPAADARAYGNLGLLASLPPNAFDLQGGNSGVRLGVSETLEITRLGEAPPERGVVSVTLPPAIRQRGVLNAFAEATRGVQRAWREPFDAMHLRVMPVDFPLAQAAQVLRARTRPELTLRARLQSQLSLAGAPVGGNSPYVAAFLPPTAAAARLRYAIGPLLDRVMAFPQLCEPMYRALAEHDPEAFMPGIGQLPPDLIMLVQVNQYFIDAFMVGANHEMNRELLWRGFPTDLRGTPFQRFWHRLGPGSEGRIEHLPDMAPIHLWGRQPLGERVDPNVTDPDRVALLIKGRLLLRYPTAAVYAWRRVKNAGPEDSKLLKGADGRPPGAADVQTPVFSGFIAPDISFFGFDIDKADIADWCFVVEEPMGEPRFGFDVPVPPPEAGAAKIGARPRAALAWAREQFALGAAATPAFQALRGAGLSPWKTLSWSQLKVDAGQHLSIGALAALSNPADRPFASFPGLSATPTAAEIAQALLQEPFRAYWEGPDLAP
ncbi:hypothetical protein IWX58_004220 [Rubrivivax gelatinosus]|uniref:hypothetical protein n=1 Tax=Rubrivivax gelatinosus TaxID=28068 RepID=UPI0018CBDA00|nr:hypothetical protein [Rubrivivax gelatinosus]MBG6082533.1 hypothetical protein [Rubrivivax gelatinosus]